MTLTPIRDCTKYAKACITVSQTIRRPRKTMPVTEPSAGCDEVKQAASA
jgi:hypothetical protein